MKFYTSVNGKTLSVSAPNFLGFFNFVAFRIWSLKFKCGSCKSEPIVQHDEVKNYHTCPVCGIINILDKTSYYD